MTTQRLLAITAIVICTAVAWFIAAKEALDLEWGQTIITVILGWIALFIIMSISGVVLGIMGFGAAAVGGMFN